MATIRELNIYPLKSGRAIAKDEVRLGVTGFEWDRHWMAASPEGVFMSQRTQPRLARVVPETNDDELILRAPDQQPLRIPLRPSGNAQPARVWKDSISALDQGDAAAQWLSEAVGFAARLLRIAPVLDRKANAEFAGTTPAPVSFSDGFPILVCNSASLEHLNSRMPEPVPMERFRPNIVLDGLEPFEEDRISELRFGAVTLRLVKPCTRCVITATDQHTGQPSTNPLPVLRAFRFNKALMGVTFGENAVIAQGVGEVLKVAATCSVVHDA
ncbi:MAG: MOSC N-terminal beta barrel domain-containing protein [Gammaproteobacteria bacterium]